MRLKNYLIRWLLPSLLATALFLAGNIEFKAWQHNQYLETVVEVVYRSIENPESFRELQEIAKEYPR